MGASDWNYVVAYGPDLEEVLAALRRTVFAAREYYFANKDDGWPATIQELFADDEVQYDGTHSVLDIFKVIGPLDKDSYGTLRPLPPQEQVSLFGTTTLTRPEFELAYAHRRGNALGGHGQRWSGYSVILHEDEGSPAEIAIWGYSGD